MLIWSIFFDTRLFNEAFRITLLIEDIMQYFLEYDYMVFSQ